MKKLSNQINFICIVVSLFHSAIGYSQQNDNKALYLPGIDGNNSHVDISGLNITSLPYTIELWMMPEEAQEANAGILFNRPGNIGLQYTSSWQHTSQSLRYMASGGDIYGQGTETPNIPAGEWSHVAIVMTDTSRTVYFNGVPRTEYSAFSADDFSTGNTYLGWDAATSSRAFTGYLDEVRVWNVVRTAEELEAARLDTLDVSASGGLVGYWNFDDGTEGTAIDGSSSGLNGTITGGSYVLSTVFAPMVYKTAEALQEDKIADDNSTDNVVMQLDIETANAATPLTIKQFDVTITGTADLSSIANIKVYTTGTSSTFNASNLIAETGESPADPNVLIATDFTLSKGHNNFWLTYDIQEGVTEGSTLDMVCNGFTLSDGVNDSIHIPSNTDPAGNLTIKPSIFIEYEALDSDTVTIAAHSAVEGSNFASFQQDAILTFNGYQYVTYWTKTSKVAIARKKLPFGPWEEMTLDYVRNSTPPLSDNHQTISMGICENDGTIHIAYDHHDVPLRYQRSVVGLASDPENHAWSGASFGARQDYLVLGTQITPVTYPRFISKPDGDLIYECRLGQSGNGDSFLWEYTAGDGLWKYIGEYINGTSISQNAYINGVHYDPSGRMHVSWVWRETPDPQTNHDVYYGYSDDDGRTWYNAAGTQVGTAGSNPMTLTSEGLKVWTVGKNRGLINQEAQAVDSQGGIHILQSYIGENHPNSNNFWGFRIDYGDLRHIYKDESGVWHSDVIAPSGRNRSEIAVDKNDNLYVVSGDHRIYFASAVDKWQTWVEFDISKAGTSQNEGFVDRKRLLEEGILSYLYASADNDGKIMISNYDIEISSNATLASILLDGTEIEGFDSGETNYDVVLPAGTTTVPSVTVATGDPMASVDISSASEVPGTTTITVTSHDGENSMTYTVNFIRTVLSSELEDQGIKVYPNPFVSNFLVESDKMISGLEVYATDGRLLYKADSIGERSKLVELKNLPKGVLLLKVYYQDQSTLKTRIIKD